MLTSVRLQGFKSFTDATVKLAPLTVLIGTNGSGKSNFLDGLQLTARFIYGMSLNAALSGDRTLPAIRAGLEITNFHSVLNFEGIGSVDIDSQRESDVFEFNGDHVNLRGALDDFAQFQVLQLEPNVLRRYEGNSGVRLMLGHNGEGFSKLASQIWNNETNRVAYLDWIQELRPEQIADFAVREGAAGDLLFGVTEKNGRWIPAPALSDGTLRFAALVAVLFQPIKPILLCIEEIENGMHPARLRLVLELLRAFVANGTQVIVTTHAPWLLAWLSQEELAATQIFYRGEDGSSQVKSCGEHGFLMDALKNTPIEELFAEGYLEQTL